MNPEAFKHSILLRRIVRVVVLTLLAACSDSAQLNSLPEDARILAFGDSLTSGVGATEGNSYPKVLSALSSRVVVNAGVSGETTELGLVRLARFLKSESPDLLILIEGGNDLLQGKNPVDTKNNLASMIRLAQDRSIPVVLIGVPEKSLFSYSAPFYEELAEEFDLVYDGTLLGKLMRTPAMKSDPIHFNEIGYARMAEGIHQLLVQRGAL